MTFSTMDGIRQNLDDWKKVGKVDSEMLFDQSTSRTVVDLSRIHKQVNSCHTITFA